MDTILFSAYSAVTSLAGACDGARSRDGVGFCRMCTEDGKRIAGNGIPHDTAGKARMLYIALHHAEQVDFSEATRKAMVAARAQLLTEDAQSLDIFQRRDGSYIANKRDGYCCAKVADECTGKVPVGTGVLCKNTDGAYRNVCAPCADAIVAARPKPAQAPKPAAPVVSLSDVTWYGSNKYDKACLVCGAMVPSLTGRLGRTSNGRWVTAHSACLNPVDSGPKGGPKDTGFTLPENTIAQLRPFQQEGVDWAQARQRGLIADEMGLGKTRQGLCLIDPAKGGIVIGPACVQGFWKEEMQKVRPDLTPTVVDRKDFRWPYPGEVIIARWTSLPVANLKAGGNMRGLERAKAIDAALELIIGDCPGGITVIADEIHYAKSPKAQRHQAFRSISRCARRSNGRIFGMTGTPLLNNPVELRSILEVVGLLRDSYGDRDTFHTVWNCWQNRWRGWEYGTPTAAAYEMLSKVMIRRLSKNVLDLPPITREVVTVPLSEGAIAQCDALLSWVGGPDALEQLLEDAIDGKAGPQGAKLFEKLSGMRAAVAAAKVPALLNILDGHVGTAAVFSCHRAPVEVLGSQPGWVTITGDDSAPQKYDTVRAFQDGESNGIKGIAYTLAGCEGVTLTRAAHLYVVSPDWTPARNAQAELRLWRIGQTKPVTVTYLEGDHIVERILSKCILKKMAMLQAGGLAGS